MPDYLHRIEEVINSGVLDQGFPRIPDSGANLDFIRIYGVHKVENEFIKELARTLRRLGVSAIDIQRQNFIIDS